MKTVIILITWASPKLAKTIHAQEQAIDKAQKKVVGSASNKLEGLSQGFHKAT